MEINSYKKGEIDENKLKYAVIVASYKESWIFVQHNSRDTWEIPGGHIEEFETADEAASRELYEETGAVVFNITPITIYSVKREDEEESFGKLYFADVKELEELPNSEIKEIKFEDELPENLTYPIIQPKLFEMATN